MSEHCARGAESAGPQRVEKYFRENEPSAKSILVQRHLAGLAEPSESRKQTCFVNEVEIVPTLYLAAKFGHRQDYVAAYGRALLKTAFEACGREAPAPDAPGTASSSPLAEANQS